MSTASPAVRAKLCAIAAERDDLVVRLADPSVLADHRQVRDLSIRKAAIDPVADDLRRAEALEREAAELRAVIEAGEDAELVGLAREELPRVEAAARAALDHAVERLVSADDESVGSVMLEIRAGAGGDEATLWTRDLLTMYESFARSRRWRFEAVELTPEPTVGGIRSAIISVGGEGVWADLAGEAGTHCVKRVPATETQGRVHTSTATVAVLPEPREVEFEVNPADVTEHVTTSQGPGGQNVNKVATAVHLIHKPTGVEVRMQETKSQQQNRERAWRLLRARLYERELARRRAEESAARLAQIGSGERSERIRTYRYKDNIAVDHRLERSFGLDAVLRGDPDGGLGALIGALRERETARRIEAL
ncbi:MAG TPA: peptide chain release factor 1 [Phycisphaerales bacterium]|nr:peptide chain release factor 1 [Phycisphaerales bacterium]